MKWKQNEKKRLNERIVDIQNLQQNQNQNNHSLYIECKDYVTQKKK